MTRLFSSPQHPGLLRVDPNKRGHEDDPHIAPSPAQLEHRETPILYLPPLLSSLPLSQRSRSDVESAPVYTETHLPDIDPVSLSLHKSLHLFRPVDDQYAAKDYWDAFNWNDVGLRMRENGEDEEREWYVVAFRSRRKVGSDGGRTSIFSCTTSFE